MASETAPGSEATNVVSGDVNETIAESVVSSQHYTDDDFESVARSSSVQQSADGEQYDSPTPVAQHSHSSSRQSNEASMRGSAHEGEGDGLANPNPTEGPAIATSHPDNAQRADTSAERVEDAQTKLSETEAPPKSVLTRSLCSDAAFASAMASS